MEFLQSCRYDLRAHSSFALLCNDVSHWLGASLESTLDLLGAVAIACMLWILTVPFYSSNKMLLYLILFSCLDSLGVSMMTSDCHHLMEMFSAILVLLWGEPLVTSVLFKGLIMDRCLLLTSTPDCVVLPRRVIMRAQPEWSPRGETTHEGVDVNNTHLSMINPDYNMMLAISVRINQCSAY